MPTQQTRCVLAQLNTNSSAYQYGRIAGVVILVLIIAAFALKKLREKKP